MITISEEALAFIASRQTPIFIDIPHTVSGCCFEITDCPSINLGAPRDTSEYMEQTLQGVPVYVPRCFPEHGEHTILLKTFLGFKRLVLSGWRIN